MKFITIDHNIYRIFILQVGDGTYYTLYYVDIDRIKTLDNLEGIEDVHNFILDYYETQTGIYVNIKKKIIALNKMQGVV